MLKHLLLLLLCFFVTDCLAEEQVNAEFPEIYNSETDLAGFLSPEDALSSLTLPPGFSATLFANEPQIQNPIAACVDSKGRVWVAENYTYAERVKRFDLNLNDRVVVLEDRDGDGAAEHRTVFFNSLKKLTGITVGQGGVWLTCPPELLFIPDADGDLVPDGPPQVVLDGFTVARENYHGFVNGLSWGPDNWLYGRCGASDPGEMGVPGSSPEERVPMRGGIWRFHPQSKVVEAITARHDQSLGARLELGGRTVLYQHGQRSPLGTRYLVPTLNAPIRLMLIRTFTNYWTCTPIIGISIRGKAGTSR